MTQNSTNLKVTNNADGFDIAGGTTARKIALTGGDVTLNGTGSATHTFPSTSSTLARTDTSQTFTGTQTFETGILSDKIIRVTETGNTPGGTTQTITLNDGNHQTLALGSSTGTVAVTLTVPTSSAAGTLIVIQHGTTPRSITWTSSAGSILWDGQPTWASDAVSSRRIIAWRWDGSYMYLSVTGVFA